MGKNFQKSNCEDVENQHIEKIMGGGVETDPPN